MKRRDNRAAALGRPREAAALDVFVDLSDHIDPAAERARLSKKSKSSAA